MDKTHARWPALDSPAPEEPKAARQHQVVGHGPATSTLPPQRHARGVSAKGCDGALDPFQRQALVLEPKIAGRTIGRLIPDGIAAQKAKRLRTHRPCKIWARECVKVDGARKGGQWRRDCVHKWKLREKAEQR